MLAYQIDYWKLQEAKRSNRVNEEINRANAETNRMNYSVNAMNAETNRLNYGVNLRNAETNAMNAETNRLNYGVNLINAETNRLNYGVNLQNAASNRMQATASLQQASAAQKQANVAQGKLDLEKYYKPLEIAIDRTSAQGSYLRGKAAADLVPSTTAVNTAKIQESYYGNELKSAQADLARAQASKIPSEVAYNEARTELSKTQRNVGISSEIRNWGSDIVGGFNDTIGTVGKLITDGYNAVTRRNQNGK